MSDVNFQNKSQNVAVMEIVAKIVESMKNSVGGIADQKQIVDLFRMAENGNLKARAICEKLGINRDVVDQVLAGGESELNFDADPKKLYEQLVFEGKKIETPDREQKLMQILDEVALQPEVAKNTFVIPTKPPAVEFREDAEDIKLEEVPKQQDHGEEQSGEDEEVEEVLDEKECLKQINRGVSTFTSLKF
jgi:hypothetical protein